MKTCTSCGIEKPLSEFHKAKEQPQGVRNHCKQCVKNYCAARYKLNKEKIDSAAREWAKANPAKCAEYAKKSRESDRYKKYHDVYDKAYSKRKTELAKERRKNNPIPHRLHEAKRRVAKSRFAETITDVQIKELFERQRGLCPICRCKLVKYEIDHVMPLAAGGEHAIGNIQLLCPDDNRAKSSKHPVDYMQQKGYLL